MGPNTTKAEMTKFFMIYRIDEMSLLGTGLPLATYRK